MKHAAPSLALTLLLTATAPGRAGPQEPTKRHETKAKVASLCFEPQGKRLAAGLGQGSIQLFDAKLSPAGELPGGDQAVTGLDWGADDLLCGSSPDGARLWKLGKRIPKEPAATIRGEGLLRCALGPKGKLLLTGGPEGLRLWKTRRGKPKRAFRASAGASAIAWGTRGKQVASGHPGQVRLWTSSGRAKGVLSGHAKESPVHALAFDPRGDSLASGGEDGVVILWDLRKGKELARLRVGSSVRALAFAPEGALLAAGCSNGKVVVFDTARRRECASLAAHEGGVSDLAFSADGERLATGGGKEVCLWDATGWVLPTFDARSGVLDLAWSPKGERLVTVGFGGARVWNARSGKELATLELPKRAGRSVSWRPDGERVSVGHAEGVTHFDAGTYEAAGTLSHGEVVALAWSPDGKVLASSAKGGSARLWDAAGKPLHELEGFKHQANDFSWAGDSKRVALSSWLEGTIRIWDPASGAVDSGLVDAGANVQGLAFTPRGDLITCEESVAKLWALPERTQERRYAPGKKNAQTLALSPDGAWLVTGGANGALRVWSAGTGLLVETLEGHEAPLVSLAFRPDGQRLASGDSKGLVRLWSVEAWGKGGAPAPTPASVPTAKLRTLTDELPDTVRSLAFTPDSKRLVASLEGRGHSTAVFVELESGKIVARIKGNDSRSRPGIDPKGRWLAYPHPEAGVALYDLAAPAKPKRTLASGKERVHDLAFSADGALLAITDQEHLRVWDPGQGKELCAVARIKRDDRTTSGEPYSHPCFSADGERLAVVDNMFTYQTTVVILDSRSGKEQGRLRVVEKGGDSSVSALAFTPQGLLVTGLSSYKRELPSHVRLWDPASGKAVRSWELRAGDGLALGPQGEWIGAPQQEDRDAFALVDVRTGAQVARLANPDVEGWGSASASPDGKLIATVGYRKLIRIWVLPKLD